MALKITVNHPAYPSGTNFEVNGLGVFENGKSVELTEEQEQQYMSIHMQTVKDGLAGNEIIKIEGTTTVKGGVKESLGVDPAKIVGAEDNAEHLAAVEGGES